MAGHRPDMGGGGGAPHYQPDVVGTAMSRWQVYVAVFSDEGGLILPAELSEPTGWWANVCAHHAARAASAGVWVRLV